ncbi:FMN-binding protein [Sediminicola luteus]|uniref:FMN-binding protein n=2 Tax=Sediminicola luteus TaxID=319238 RepID=A0A2A4G8I0_9FLAO|nr:FMN-binding protein [Sediminicola luteus]
MSVVVCVLIPLLYAFSIPGKLGKKVNKELGKLYPGVTYNLAGVEIPAALQADLPLTISSTNFFAMSDQDQTTGYVFLGKAPSKTADFDYMVVFDADLSIVHSKVLIYREEYGGEIGSKRWLKQFLGKTPADRLDADTNVDAISGATISVRSMTRSLDGLLQSVKILQENKVL